MRIPIVNAKKKLAIVWIAGAIVLIIFVLLQTFYDKFGDRANEAWAWLLPTFVPTLSTIFGSLASDSLGKNEGNETATADQFVFRIAFFLSFVYFLVVLLTILLHPLSNKSLLDLMKISNIWLAPFQGLVSIALGAFFVSKK